MIQRALLSCLLFSAAVHAEPPKEMKPAEAAALLDAADRAGGGVGPVWRNAKAKVIEPAAPTVTLPRPSPRPPDPPSSYTIIRATLLKDPQISGIHQWSVPVRVELIEKGDAPSFKAGAKLVFNIHSPALLFNGPAVPLAEYRFSVGWIQRGPDLTEFTSIELLP